MRKTVLVLVTFRRKISSDIFGLFSGRRVFPPHLFEIGGADKHLYIFFLKNQICKECIRIFFFKTCGSSLSLVESGRLWLGFGVSTVVDGPISYDGRGDVSFRA